jgi:hypothetical protein
MWGFKDLKDVLDVLVVPLVIFGFGLWLPRLLEKQKRDSFFSLIQPELEEMVPQSDLADHGASWCDYLGGICKFFDKRKRPSSMSASLENTVFKVWKELIISYHPELETKGRLSGEA